jgi:hypothetical protein
MAIIFPKGICRSVAGGELLIYVNDTIALNAFSFTYSEWNPNAATPQYQNYLDWVKQFLNKKQPVIISVYVSGMTDPDYDHIIPAIGFSATSVNSYSATDSLFFNTNFDTVPFKRIFSSLYGTRAVANNSAPFAYYVPQNVDYGAAVTGNKDPGHVTKPIHIVLDSNDEPNVSLSAQACILKATLTIDSLTSGQSYALLRYNNYLNVPSTGFSPSGANSVVYFTATATTKIIFDSFMSDSAVFYRCIPYTFSSANEIHNTVYESALAFPNPTSGRFTLILPDDTKQIEIVDVVGQTIQKVTVSNKEPLDMYLENKGVYFVRLSGGTSIRFAKIVVTN